jgi:hypothetical protein
MAGKSNHIISPKITKAVPLKSARIIKRLSGNSSQDVIVSGFVGNQRKTFRFKSISTRQQMRERNNAYRFFSLK